MARAAGRPRAPRRHRGRGRHREGRYRRRDLREWRDRGDPRAGRGAGGCGHAPRRRAAGGSLRGCARYPSRRRPPLHHRLHLRRRPRHRCPVPVRPRWGLLRRSCAAWPTTWASTWTPLPGPDRGVRSRADVEAAAHGAAAVGTVAAEAESRARGPKRRDARGHSASHGALQARDSALLPRYPRSIFSRSRTWLEQFNAERPVGERLLSALRSSSRRSRRVGRLPGVQWVLGRRPLRRGARSPPRGGDLARGGGLDCAGIARRRHEDPRRAHPRSA